jgi:ABC-type antimicrobial peptide transport system permease subunit
MLEISALMALVGIAACAVPARRALRAQPTEAIRGVE